MMTSERLVIANERSPQCRLHTQRFEKPTRDSEPRQPLRIATIDEVGIPPHRAGKKVQRARFVAPVKEVRRRHRLFLELEVGGCFGKQDDRVGVLERIWPEYEPIDQVEDGRIRAKAK